MSHKITPKEIDDFTGGKWSPDFFNRHVCCFLRAHPQLLENADYQKLYQETLEYQFDRATQTHGWTEKNRADIRFFEILADLINEDERATKFTAAQVNAFLAHRRSIWNNEKKTCR